MLYYDVEPDSKAMDGAFGGDILGGLAAPFELASTGLPSPKAVLGGEMAPFEPLLILLGALGAVGLALLNGVLP